MSSRFRIDDLLAQDDHGVIFRAEELATGRRVALRRIFPFGMVGGGLTADQRRAYEIGLRRFTEVRHPGLRDIIGGGCDPVDGMPFLATEWVEGPTLEKAMDGRPVQLASVVALMDRALEVCEVLSEALAEEAVWVETAPSAIVIATEDVQRGFTFWLSPLSWLDENGGPKGLAPLVALFKRVSERPDPRDSPRLVTDLKKWGEWLEANASQLTAAQARRALQERFVVQPVAEAAQGTAVDAATEATPAVAVELPPEKRQRVPPGMTTGPLSSMKPTGVIKPAGVGKKGGASTKKAIAPARQQAQQRKAQGGGGSIFRKILTFLVVAACLGGAGFQYYRYQEAKKTPALAAADPAADARASAARASAVHSDKPGQVEATIKLPAAFLGKWNYEDDKKVKHTNEFKPDGSFVQTTKGQKLPLTGKIFSASETEVVVDIDNAPQIHHVIAKDGKSLKIDEKYNAVK